MDRPHPGQNPAFAGTDVSQREQITSVGGSAGLDETSPIGLLSAFLADTINLERMASGSEVMFAADLLLEFADFG